MENMINPEKVNINSKTTKADSGFDPVEILKELKLTNNYAGGYYILFR